MTKPIKRVVMRACALFVILISTNYIGMMDYVRIPGVESLEYSYAQNKLRDIGLDVRPVSSSNIISIDITFTIN